MTEAGFGLNIFRLSDSLQPLTIQQLSETTKGDTGLGETIHLVSNMGQKEEEIKHPSPKGSLYVSFLCSPISQYGTAEGIPLIRISRLDLAMGYVLIGRL